MIQFNIGFNIARVGQSVELALIALAAIFLALACILTMFYKKYRILRRRDKSSRWQYILKIHFFIESVLKMIQN